MYSVETPIPVGKEEKLSGVGYGLKIIKANGLISIRDDTGNSWKGLPGFSCDTLKKKFNNLFVSSDSLADDFVIIDIAELGEQFGGDSAPLNVTINPLPNPVNVLVTNPDPTVFQMNNPGVQGPLVANIDMSGRVGQPALWDLSFGWGNAGGAGWSFHDNHPAFGAFNGIWFKLQNKNDSNNRGLFLIPTEDIADQSAAPDFNVLACRGYLQTNAGFMPINLADGSYIPAIGDEFYVEFDGRSSFYAKLTGALPNPGSMQFLMWFNYGTQPNFGGGGASPFKLFDNATFNSAVVSPVDLVVPRNAKGFYLYITGNFDGGNNFGLTIYFIDPITGAKSLNTSIFYPTPMSATPTSAWILGVLPESSWNIVNTSVAITLPQKLHFEFSDSNATPLTPDLNVFVVVEFIY